MNISGVLVRAYPENLESVTDLLTSFEGVEVHGNKTVSQLAGNCLLSVSPGIIRIK